MDPQPSLALRRLAIFTIVTMLLFVSFIVATMFVLSHVFGHGVIEFRDCPPEDSCGPW